MRPTGGERRDAAGPAPPAEPVYLDHNAATPLCAAARAAMEPWWGRPANPSSVHRFGREAEAAVHHARQQVAAALGWPVEGVVFTSGATEANTTALGPTAPGHAAGPADPVGAWLGAPVEHPSVAAWLDELLPVDGDGRLDLAALDARLAPARLAEAPVAGISVQLANHETGVLQPVAEVLALAERRGVRVHVDAAQGLGKLDVRARLGGRRPALLTLSSHKLGGPAGVGALLVAPGVTVEPLLRGGPQERRRRAGTHAVAAIVGFGAAVEAARPMDPTLRDHLEAGLVALGGLVAGAGAPRLPNTVTVGFEPRDPALVAADLVAALDIEGVAVSAGAACASGSPEPSPVLEAMGFPGSAVRFSLGPDTAAAEVEVVLAALRRVLERVL